MPVNVRNILQDAVGELTNLISRWWRRKWQIKLAEQMQRYCANLVETKIITTSKISLTSVFHKHTNSYSM